MVHIITYLLLPYPLRSCSEGRSLLRILYSTPFYLKHFMGCTVPKCSQQFVSFTLLSFKLSSSFSSVCLTIALVQHVSSLTKKLPLSKNFHFSPVSLTPVINLYFRIAPRILVKIRNGPHGILNGPGETGS
jgi:hypothetical protein